MTHRGRCIHFSSQAPRRSRCALVHHSSSQAPRLLALRARPPQLVASSSAARAAPSALALRARPPQLVASSSVARAARSPTTARCRLLGARAARSPPRRLALRARSRCALARHSSSQAYRALVLLDGRSRKLPLPPVRSRLRPCGSEVLVRHRKIGLVFRPRVPRECAARPTGAAVKRLG